MRSEVVRFDWYNICDYIEGLSEGKFDACVSRAVTEDRLKYFEFSIPYAKSYARFFTLPNNPRRFDEENVSGKTIGERRCWLLIFP